jgi:hypothetical protein
VQYPKSILSCAIGSILVLSAACSPDAEPAVEMSRAAAQAAFLPSAPPPPDPGDPVSPPPPAPRELAPAIIRGIFVNAYAAGSPERRAELLELTKTTEINAWVVDVKDDDGIRYRSEIPLAQELSEGKPIPLRNLAALVELLDEHGIYPIARVVVFKDTGLARARPDWAIRTPEGAVWHDRVRNGWVSPWSREVWEYTLQVAEEAARAGFREIQFDYVRFPEAYRSLPRQVHRAAPDGGSRTDAIAGFLAEARERLHPLGVTITADLFGLSMNEARDVGIGHQWERISTIVDHVHPMVYPSHYFPTHLRGVPRPNRMPYETVFTSVGMGVIRNERLRDAGAEPARLIPWLQAFTATWVDKDYPYGPEQLREQLRAVYELGLEDWILWNAGSRYGQVAAGLEPHLAPQARPFRSPAELVAAVDRFDRDGVAEIRSQLRRTPDSPALAGAAGTD